MKTIRKPTLVAAMLVVAAQPAAAVTLQFDYSLDANNFFGNQARRTVLENAGSFFSTAIHDDLTAITSSGRNNFSAVFSNPATGTSERIDNFSVAADTLIVYAGGRAMGGSTLGIGGSGGYSASGSSAFIDNAITRGETPLPSGVQGSSATDFAPWGGAISFNSTADWYFDDDTGTTEPFGGNDFFSVALHELGHLLGIGSADSWDNLVSGSEFTGAASTAVFGGKVPLDSDLSHWANGTTGLVDGVPQEAAMDPTIRTGTRKLFTDLDMAALADTGWEVTPVPVPAALWLFASGLTGLVTTARRRARISV